MKAIIGVVLKSKCVGIVPLRLHVRLCIVPICTLICCPTTRRVNSCFLYDRYIFWIVPLSDDGATRSVEVDDAVACVPKFVVAKPVM